MKISSYELNPTSLNSLLQIPNKYYQNEEWISIKQFLVKDNHKVTNLTNLDQAEVSIIVSKDDDFIPKG